MGNLMNLAGQRYGKLIALNPGKLRVTKGGHKLKTWVCQCDCGNIATIPIQSLINGSTKSCGCSYAEDLTGQKFGKLTVLKSSINKNKQKMWICICDCGNELEVLAGSLKSGHTRSCGCIRAIEITGKKFGRLTAIKKIDRRDNSGNVYWLCKCDCGAEIETQGRSLRKGLTKSCGCIQREHSKNMNRKHGKSRTRIYLIWLAMKSRCFSESDANYHRYGGRGITISNEWIGERGFDSFYLWAMSHGYDDNLTIERIDVDGNYEVSNCKWVTQKEQMQNTRRSRYVKYSGKIYSISELSEKLNLTYMQTWHRFRNISFGMNELTEDQRIERAKNEYLL